MLKLLKQRPGSATNLKKKDDDDTSSATFSLSPPSSMLKRPTNFTPQLFNNASIVIAIFAQSLISFAVYKSSTSSGPKMINLAYQCSSAVVMSEIIKLIVAVIIVWVEFEYNVPKTMETMLFDVFQVHTFAVSGVLYAISSVTYIKMLSEFGLLYSYYSLMIRICFTTLIWKFTFNQKQITNKQWMSIGLIIISTACLTLEYPDSLSFFPFLSNSVISATPSDIELREQFEAYDNDDIGLDLGLDAVVDVNDIELHEHGRSLLRFREYNMFTEYWFAWLLLEAICASVGSVIAEQKYKTFEKNLSYFAQSSSMYLWSLVIASILFYIANLKQASKQLLLLNLTYAIQGFNVWTWFLVFVLVLFGYSSNYVIKYANNIVVLMALSVAICFSHILVYWIHDAEFVKSVGVFCVLSYLCVGISVYLYGQKI